MENVPRRARKSEKLGPKGPEKMEIGPEGPEKIDFGGILGVIFLVIFLVPRAGRQGRIRPNLFFFLPRSLFFSGLAGGLFFQDFFVS